MYPLHCAIKSNDFNLVRELIQNQNCDVNEYARG